MLVEAIWLRTIGGRVQVLFESLDKWYLAIEESAEPIDTISHVAEHPALEKAPIAACSKTDSTDEIEVTRAMIDAAFKADQYSSEDPWSWRFSAIYCAMERVRRREAAALQVVAVPGPTGRSAGAETGN